MENHHSQVKEPEGRLYHQWEQIITLVEYSHMLIYQLYINYQHI